MVQNHRFGLYGSFSFHSYFQVFQSRHRKQLEKYLFSTKHIDGVVSDERSLSRIIFLSSTLVFGGYDGTIPGYMDRFRVIFFF